MGSKFKHQHAPDNPAWHPQYTPASYPTSAWSDGPPDIPGWSRPRWRWC
jgi:hypothetical protein